MNHIAMCSSRTAAKGTENAKPGTQQAQVPVPAKFIGIADDPCLLSKFSTNNKGQIMLECLDQPTMEAKSSMRIPLLT